MNDTKTGTFFAGLIMGPLIMMGILIILHATPLDQEKRDRQEAISHGYAHWTVNTNGVTTFKWNNDK